MAVEVVLLGHTFDDEMDVVVDRIQLMVVLVVVELELVEEA